MTKTLVSQTAVLCITIIISLFIIADLEIHYSCKSSAEHGTLYQLRNKFNRKNVKSDPLKDFNACDDFFVLVVKSHIITITMKALGMNSMEDTPTNEYLKSADTLWMENEQYREEVLKSVSLSIVDSLNFQFNTNPKIWNLLTRSSLTLCNYLVLDVFIWSSVMLLGRGTVIECFAAGGICSLCL